MGFWTVREYGLHDCNFALEYCRRQLIAQPPNTKMQQQAGFCLDDGDMRTVSSVSNGKGSSAMQGATWMQHRPQHKRQAMTEQPEKPKSKLDISS